MKVLALLSGGKDSCYSIYKATQHGHDVVAAAHIAPRAEVLEEDSFMFQSAGSALVQQIADCMRIPLYVARFDGTEGAIAKNTELAYRATPGDEVEVLFELVRCVVQKHHTDIEGILSGAILSDYQRLRVESICDRLNLRSYAYLWRRSQRELLQEMISNGIHAIIVKVACMGLGPEVLGQDLALVQPLLHDLEEKYGVHVCGEGGEYETLVLDMPLFKEKIVPDSMRVTILSEDRFAPVAVCVVETYHLEVKTHGACSIPAFVPPRIFAPESDLQHERSPTRGTRGTMEKRRSSIASRPARAPVSISFDETSGWGRAYCVGKEVSVAGDLDISRMAAAQLKQIVETLESVMKEVGCNLLRDVFYCQLYLKDMTNFGAINAAYKDVFAACDHAPTRTCIQIPMPESTFVELEILFGKCIRKSVMHVKSLSEWAPPCIGPYSQASELCGSIFLCGMIALEPYTAQVPATLSAARQCQICLQHIQRTLDALKSDFSHVLVLTIFIDEFVAGRIGDIRQIVESTSESKILQDMIIVSALPANAMIEIQAVARPMGTDEELSPKYVSERLSSCWIRATESSMFGYGILDFTIEDIDAKGTDAVILVASQYLDGRGVRTPMVLRAYICSQYVLAFETSIRLETLKGRDLLASITVIESLQMSDPAVAIKLHLGWCGPARPDARNQDCDLKDTAHSRPNSLPQTL
ncbi:Diphthine--ammonia ligase [Porphyridium purpureum]|uniref:Diphthine--ammonia ligase n=1 Tax=Porphyridium purpureum TaxID=35688 RepID=A0A5J4YXZ3_PORPP|nr:Diphthine--ammonia ligase [Porphyridium purpureum]|eukprot:POR9673..scf209_3